MKQTTNDAPGPTAPQHLLRELAGLGNLVFGMFGGPRVAAQGWPVAGLVYAELDGLCRAVNRLGGHLARGFADGDGDGAAAADRITDANACFARLDDHVRVMADLLARGVRDRLSGHDNPVLDTVLRHHLAPGSAWLRGLHAHYCSGRVSADGRVLARTVLPLDVHPAAGRGEEPAQARQVFELASPQARTRLGRTVRQVLAALNQVHAALRARLAADGAASMGLFYSARTLEEVHLPVKDLPGRLAVYVSRDGTFATIGTRGFRPADGMRGLIVHAFVDVATGDAGQPCHNVDYAAAGPDELRSMLIGALAEAGIVPAGPAL